MARLRASFSQMVPRSWRGAVGQKILTDNDDDEGYDPSKTVRNYFAFIHAENNEQKAQRDSGVEQDLFFDSKTNRKQKKICGLRFSDNILTYF